MLRISRIGAGIALGILGLVLLVLPGPGILTIAGGLAILAIDFAWARNLLDWMKSRFRQSFPDPGVSPLRRLRRYLPQRSLRSLGEETEH